MKVNAPLYSLNAGEVSKIALGRVDVAKLRMAAETQVNWSPFVLGPMMLRPGLLYVGEVASDNPAALIDFIYSKTDTSLVELTNLSMRVWISDALISRVSVATALGAWSTADTTDGCTATTAGTGGTLLAAARGGLARFKQTLTIAGGDQNKEHALRIVVADGPVTIRVGSAAGLQDYMTSTAIDDGTHSLVFTPTAGSAFVQIESTDTWTKNITSVAIEAAGVLTVPTPWAAATLSSLRWTQSGDIIYVAQYGGQQYKIERRGTRPGARGWSVVKYKSSAGPFLNLPSLANVTMTPSVYEGSGTLTSSAAFFQSGHVGALFRLFSPGQNNVTTLGALGAFSDPVRISGTGTERKITVTVTGTWVGTLTFQRSFLGPDSGFSTSADFNNATLAANGTSNYNDLGAGGPGQTVVWLRVGFVNSGDYTSGAAAILWGNTIGGTSSTNLSGAPSAGGQYGTCRVTGYTSPTVVSIEVLSAFSTLLPTTNWVESAWSGVQGWPTSVAFQEGRLWWLSAANFPVTGSQSNNYTGFAAFDRYGTSLGDSGVITSSFGEGPSDRVNWALPLQRLLLGREQSIASVRSSSFDTPLTPTDFSVKDCSQQGAARLPAVKIGTRGVFVEQAGAKVYSLTFAPQTGDYQDQDLTRLNIDIGKPGFVDIAKATQPDTVIYLPRPDGEVACLLYDPNDEVEAWFRYMTLGVVEKVRRLPNNTGGQDDFVYFVVNRTINGVTRRFIEKLAQRSNCIGGLANQQLDCAYVYSGGAVTSITMAWLPSTTVSVWADGAFIGTGTTDGSGVLTPLPDNTAHSNIVAGLAGATVTYSGAAASTMTGLSAYNGIPGEFFGDQQPSGRMVYLGTLTPSGGSITLPNGISAANITGFFGYMAPFMSAKLAYAAQLGSALSQKKRIDHVGLIMFDTHNQGLQTGQRFDVLDQLPQYEDDAQINAGGIWSEFDQPTVEVAGEWNTDARLCLLGTAPYPVKVGGVVVSMTTNEK